MPVLISVTVLVGALALVDLVLTFGVVRRLREHTELLDRLSGNGPVMTPAGGTAADFAATTANGEPVSRDLLSGTTLLGVLSPDCPACREKLPRFAELARDHPGGRGQVLAVVVAPSDDEAAPVVAELAGVARVVRDAGGGPVTSAFAVHGYPAFALLGPGGTVLASGSDLAELAPAAV